MSLISFICLIICLGIIVSTFRRDADIFSPARVFGFIWCLAIGLADLKLSRLQHVWTLESWIQLLIGIGSFLMGTFILYVLNLNSRLLPISKIRENLRLQTIDHQKLYKSIIILFILFLAIYAVLILTGREIPLFSSRPGQARIKLQIRVVGLLINNVVIIIFLTVMYCVTDVRKQFKRVSLIIVAVIAFLMFAITLQRLGLFTAITLSVVLIYYSTHKIRPSTVILFFVIALAVFSISLVRSGVMFQYDLYVGSKMRLPLYLAFITEPYMYIVMNLEMFIHSINQIDQYTYGYYTFDFVTALTGIKHLIQDYFNLDETPFLYSGYNTYTAFWTYYRDFGILGVFFISLLGGSGISALYYSMRKKPQLKSVTAYCISVYLMLLSVCNNQIGFLWIVYEFTIIYLIVCAVSKTSKLIDV